MDYRHEYEKWLSSPALSEAERAELEELAVALIERRLLLDLLFLHGKQMV